MQRFIPRSLSAIALAWVVLAAQLSAAPNPKTNAPNKEPKIDQIRKVLDSVVSFEQGQVTLTDLLSKLSEDHKIPFILDNNALPLVGLDPATTMVDAKQKDVKLRTGLRNLIHPHNLTLAIVGEHVVITTEEIALYKQFKQRIDINLNEVPLSKAMKDLSHQYGVNIVLDPKCVKAKTTENLVTLQLEDVTFEAVVRLMTEMAGLKAARLSNVIYITTEERADKINKDSDLIPNPNPDFPGGGNPNNNPAVPGLGGVLPAQPMPMPVVPPPVPPKE